MTDIEYYTCRIVNIITETPYLKRFFIQYECKMPYLSGQFVIIEFGSLNHQFSTRSYSIADRSQGDTIELCVVLKENGAATPLLFDQNIGDTLKVSNPQGRFTLPEDCRNDIHYGFICTGTGVAPFRAMIKDLLEIRHISSPIYLYFGCRTQSDILYKEEFEAFQSEWASERDDLYEAIDKIEVSVHSLNIKAPAQAKNTKPAAIPHEAELRRWRYLGITRMGPLEQAFFNTGKLTLMAQKNEPVLGEWRLTQAEKELAILTHSQGKSITLKSSQSE